MTVRRMIGIAVSTALPALVWARTARAGMPYFPPTEVPEMVLGGRWLGLTSLTRARLETTSFFLLGILLCAGAIRLIWNGLRSDFPALPRLSFARALGLVVLWGLLFVLVLTMISGARELMTPGAWERNGLTYRLVPEPTPPPDPHEARRREALRRLWTKLREGAAKHEGRFPSRAEIPEDDWRVPGSRGLSYLYREGHHNDEDIVSVLACEPEGVGYFRFVLLTDGDVRLLPGQWIDRELSEERRP